MLRAILNEYTLRAVFADYGVSSGQYVGSPARLGPTVTGRKTQSFNGFCCLIPLSRIPPGVITKGVHHACTNVGSGFGRWGVAGVGSVKGDETRPPPELKCPVSGNTATKDHAVDFDGGKVYFCCDNCPKAFEANPAKFAAKAHFRCWKRDN